MNQSDRDRDVARRGDSFLRETRVGLSVVGILFCIFLYVSFARLSGWFDRGPVFPSQLAMLDDDQSTDAVGPKVETTIVEHAIEHPIENTQESESSVDTPRIDIAPKLANVPHVETEGNVSNKPSAFVPRPSFAPQDLATAIPIDVTSGNRPRQKKDERMTTQGRGQPAKPRPSNIAADSEARDKPLLAGPKPKFPSAFVRHPPLRSEGSFDRATNGNQAVLLEQSGGQLAQSPSQRPTQVLADPHVLPTSASQRSTDPLSLKASNANGAKVGEGAFPRKSGVVVEPARFVEISENDTFWTLAQNRYGDGRLFRALHEWNKHLLDELEEIPIGVHVELPSEAELVKRFPDLCPQINARQGIPVALPVVSARAADSSLTYYIVQASESVFDIARNELGQASRYLELLELNRNILPTNCGHEQELPAGLRLRLPAE